MISQVISNALLSVQLKDDTNHRLLNDLGTLLKSSTQDFFISISDTCLNWKNKKLNKFY
jgi:hypothetical protein